MDDILKKEKYVSQIHRLVVDAGPVSLVQFLDDSFASSSNICWRRAFSAGGVYVNRKQVTLSDTVEAGDVIVLYALIDGALERIPRFRNEFILYRDSDVAFVFKPAGLPSGPVPEQRVVNLESGVRECFAQAIHIPSRLDVGVSGVVPVSLSVRMNRHFQRAFDRSLIHKRYLLVSKGQSQDMEFEVLTPVGVVPYRQTGRRSSSEKNSATRFLRLGPLPDGEYLYEARPITGRTHQIRKHAAAAGIPISGDSLYGGSNSKYPPLKLLCLQVSLYQPFSNVSLEVGVPRELRPKWLQFDAQE